MPVFDALGSIDGVDTVDVNDDLADGFAVTGLFGTSVPDDDPVLQDFAGGDADDATPDEPAATKVKRPTLAGAEARAAITKALGLLGAGGKMPNADSRAAIDRLAYSSGAAQLQAERADMKALVSDVLNWAGTNTTTGAVVKTVAKVMLADGHWPQAVEMLSFAAACAPLLDPDRLSRVIAVAAETDTAYAPIRYTGKLAGDLKVLLERYQPARRETLLVSLWDLAHDGRWWNHTAGLTAADTPRRRRRRGETEVEDASLADRLADGSLHWDPTLLDTIGALKLHKGQIAELISRRDSGNYDPDVAVIASMVDCLAPHERFESPIPTMVTILREAIADAEDGDELPAKPTSWGKLYPDASLKPYPIPAEIGALDGALLPGTGEGTANPPARLELLRTPNALFANRDHMGNCTGGYDSRCREGSTFISRIYFDGAVFNASVMRVHGDRWRLGEINSQFNRGGVPDAVREGFLALIAPLAP